MRSTPTNPGLWRIGVARPLYMVVSLLLAFTALPATAQETPARPATSDWDATLARGATRTIDFVTREGTFMSTDIAPDGAWIVFDIMGHVYRMPAAGGDAESLTQASGVAWNVHPRYSPDGRHIAFVSDRGGQDNLWVMGADGSDPRAVFENKDVRVRTPVWTPDGEYIVVRRQGGGGGSGGTGLWMYHRDGGSGVELVGSGEDGSPYWPSISADGRYMYYHVQFGGSEPLGGGFQLRRYDFETGEILELTSGNDQGPASGRHASGDAFAPAISPDGRRLAFARNVLDGTISYEGHEYGPRTALWIRDLETGAERKVMDPITVATGSHFGILPPYAWTADGSAIVITEGGLIRRLDPETGNVETIPFEARVQRTISERAAADFRITDDPFQPVFLRWHSASPDGSMLAFQAVGRIWVMDLPNGTPRRLTSGDGRDMAEFAPSWSPDGRTIAYTTLDANNQGHVWTVGVGGGEPRQITDRPDFYTSPDWSPDGSHIVAIRGAGITAQGRTVTQTAYFEVVRIPASGGAAEMLATISKPKGQDLSSYARRATPITRYGPGDRIYFTAPLVDEDSDDAVTALESVTADGSDRRVHMTFPHADAVVPSPDGRHVAYDEGGNIYLAPFPGRWQGGDPVHIDKASPDLPVTTITRRGGLFPGWQDDGTLEYGNAEWHFTYDLESETKDSTRVEMTVPVHRASGVVAVVGGRVLTMAAEGPGVIEGGTVVAEDGRIRCVGTANECDTSDADHTVDASGKTVIPGLIDMHSHHYRENRGHRPPNDYESAMYLAYGFTTTLDNSMWSQNIFPTAERIRSGNLIGPRTYSTGDPLYEGWGPNQNLIRNYEDAEDNVLRLKSWGAVAIKQYSNPRRDQRQWITDAGRKAGLMVTGHWNPGVIMDGHTGFEHALEQVPLFRDITTFYGQADAVYVPTMVVSGPGPTNLERWFTEDDVWKQEKQERWMPWRMRTFLRWRDLRPLTDYSYPLVAQGMKEIIEAGGYGAIGGHGEHHGLAPHYEIWMAAEALGAMGALDVATRQGAIFLGAEEDVGTLEPGKLADLLVLDSNPLDDIRNTLDIALIMQGGILYDGDLLDEIWPTARPFGPYPWLNPDIAPDDTRPVRPEGR